MTLDTQQQILIEQRISNDAKSPLIAYLLLIFLGGFGAHRFYLGRSGSGAVMLILFALGWLTLAVAVGAVFLLIVGIWAFVDLFLVPGMIATDKNRLRETMRAEMQMMADARPADALPGPATA